LTATGQYSVLVLPPSIRWNRWLHGLLEGWFLLGLVIIPSAWSFHTLDFAHARLALICGFLGLLALIRVTVPLTPEGGRRAGWLIGGIAGWALLMTLGSAAFPHGLAMAAERLIRVLPILLYVLTAADLCVGPAAVRALGGLTTGGLIITVLAFGQFTGLLSKWFPVFPQYDQPVYSVFGNQNFLGGYLAVCAGIALGVASAGFRQTPGRYIPTLRVMLWLTVAGILSSGVILSASRTALLALITAGGVALCQTVIRSSRKQHFRFGVSPLVITLTAGGILIGLLFFLSWRSGLCVKLLTSFSAADTGWQVRWWLWNGAWRAWTEHPLTGIGWNRFILAAPILLGEVLWHKAWPYIGNPLLADTTHSEPLQLLAETGLFGGLLFLLFAVIVFRRVKPPSVVLPALAAFGVFCLFNSPLRDPAFGLAGLILLVSRPGPASHAEVPLPTKGGTGRMWPLLIRLGSGVLSILCAVAGLWFVVIPGMYLRSALDAHATGRPDQALFGYAAAGRHAVLSIEAQALENRALALLDLERYAEALAATDQALNLGWDTGRLSWIRALAAERVGNRLEAERAAAACLRRWPFHEPAWDLLLRNAPASRRAAWSRRQTWWHQRHAPLPSTGQ